MLELITFKLEGRKNYIKTHKNMGEATSKGRHVGINKRHKNKDSLSVIGQNKCDQNHYLFVFQNHIANYFLHTFINFVTQRNLSTSHSFFLLTCAQSDRAQGTQVQDDSMTSLASSVI